MKKELYHHEKDARKAAEVLAAEVRGTIESASADSATDFDWTERSVPSWSGETGAYLVIGEDGTQEGLFAFWD